MTPFIKLSAAGFAATAITFGPARMGFGLFLAEFKSTFSLSTGMAGVISGIGFFGFFLGLLISYAMTARSGPRRSEAERRPGQTPQEAAEKRLMGGVLGRRGNRREHPGVPPPADRFRL